MESIWKKTAELPEFHTLTKDIRTKVLIIGGGMAGILCAYFLQRSGVDYCLLEADTICSGVTGNTTAKITSQHGLIYDSLISRAGREIADGYLCANELALKRYKDLGWLIDCDMKEVDSYVFDRMDAEKLKREAAAVMQLGFPAEYVGQVDLPFETAGAVRFPNQAQFHPLKFVAAIAKNLNIYEHSPVREMTEYFALTDHGSVAAEKVIVATHFPFINRRGSYFVKLYQERSYVLSLKNTEIPDGIYLEAKKGGLSLRGYEDTLLLGGITHRTGKEPDGFEKLREQAKLYFPEAEITGQWAAQDCMTLDGLPYIGNYSSSTPDLFVAGGFGKWGMTGAMISAIVLSDLVQGRENEFAAIFNPSRGILKPQLAINMWEAMKGILKPHVKNRCTHMGCVLHWNAKEQTFECPCHGSCFDASGEVLENPARHKLENKSDVF
jgi:glycine/D-amino acid oxidase-like deaminating enzyme